MGLNISSIEGLVSASGYKLVILTFGLSGMSPEGRVIGRNFRYLAETLGRHGMIVTGSYDEAFSHDARGFLSQVARDIYHEMLDEPAIGSSPPVPAFVVLRKPDSGSLESGYFSIEDKSEQEIVALFRSIADAAENDGGIQALNGNLNTRHSELGRTVWDALILEPNWNGLGIRIRPLIDYVRRRRDA